MTRLEETPRLAISLHQPHPTLILLDIKNMTSRDWRPSSGLIGKRLALHATLTPDHMDAYALKIQRGISVCMANLPVGAIVGTARVADIITESDSDWFHGPYALVFEDTRIIDPVRCRGNRKIWQIPDDARALLAQREARPLTAAFYTAPYGDLKARMAPLQMQSI